VVGDRWSLLLIRDLLGGRKRFGQLVAAPEAIPTNILAERLERLEQHSLIRRIPYNSHPPRFEYELTSKGRELGRPLAAIAEWGLRHIPGTTRTLWPKLEASEP
jgi:DNA-binding HxlR family transcriptional regulator